MARTYFSFARRLATRRQFLQPFILLPLGRGTAIWAGQVEPSQEGEFRLSELTSLSTILTPNDRFYVRNHFPAPKINAAEWKLQVTGQVRSSFGLNYADLRRLPSRTITATLECAGNGVGRGGVSTATWTGVPLAEVLRHAGLRPGVAQIRLLGADRGREESSQPAIPFARSLPLEKALHPDTILVFEMNGQPLPAEHGYPVRVIVPGWYGMDSVKWIVQVEALDHEDTSLYMTKRYVSTRLQTIGSEQSPLTTMRVKSLIVQPREGEILPLASFVIRGAAWAGENPIAMVEVSTSGGAEWSPASIDTDRQPYTWVLWSYPWEIRARGAYALMARATDAKGNAQPSARDPARLDSYELNGYHRVLCQVG